MLASLREKQSLPINLFVRFWVHLQDTFRAGGLALADGQHDLWLRSTGQFLPKSSCLTDEQSLLATLTGSDTSSYAAC